MSDKNIFNTLRTDPNAEFMRDLYPTEAFNKMMVEIFDQDQKVIEDIELTGDDVIPPKLLCVTHDSKNNDVNLILVEFSEFGSDKFKMMYDVGKRVAKDHFVIATFFCSEAFMGQGEEDENGKQILPSQLPPEQRQDAYTVFGMTLDGRVNLASAIMRKINKKAMFMQKHNQPYDDGNPAQMESGLLQEFFRGFVEERFLKPKKGDVPNVTVNESKN
jgi:hypothetical protein